MKIIRILCLCLWAVLAHADDLEWIRTYQEGGIKAIENKIDSIMQTPSYWTQALQEKDTRFGYYEHLKYLFIATKNEPTLKLYALENNQWKEKISTTSLVGSKGGHKEKEGDLATPIGVYTLDARLTNLDQYYGPFAFTTNYPNLLDRLQHRTGNGIWIHGMPLDGNRKDLNTRGCIAIENDTLANIDKIINHKNTLLITYEDNKIKEVSKEDLGTLLAALNAWKQAWKVNDIDKYLGFYGRDFIRFDGMLYDEFTQMKRQIFRKNERKEIAFSDINISPYPNDKNRNLFKIAFFEDYKAPGYTFRGPKEIYVELKDSKMQIIAER